MRRIALVVLTVLLLVGLVAAISAAWISYALRSNPVSPDIADGILDVVEKYPDLKPSYAEAMEDGVLTMVEANHILAAAESKPSRELHTWPPNNLGLETSESSSLISNP